ncbi:MAG: MAPEG family protein [Xanthomonadales bacterium]|nr:MAPEG family protein [Xanthomonadales bacterium]
MNQTALILSSVAMFTLTICCLFFMGYSRFRAIRAGEVRISFFRTYDEGSQPKRLHLISRHVQNHFEVPPLFHIAVLLNVFAGATTTAALVCAWAFVAARVAHTAIHLGSNNVSRRFFVFGFSLLMLLGLMINLTVHLLRS